MTLLGQLILSTALLPGAVNHGFNGPLKVGQSVVRNESAVTLTFKEFLVLDQGQLKPSPRLLALNGKRVRLVGFMAQMEIPPLGAFYLCPRPIFCDEEGGGTADLPPESVLVIVRSQRGKEIPFTPRALEVTGILEVGNKQASDGPVSFVRLILDLPEGKSVAG